MIRLLLSLNCLVHVLCKYYKVIILEFLIPGIDLLSVVGGVDITGGDRGKKGGSSFADSAIGTSKHSAATGTGISQFSEVRWQIHVRILRFTIVQN